MPENTMKEYVTLDTVTLASGLIGLDKAQASARAYALNPVPLVSGIYEITDRIQFKKGEIITLDPDKSTLSRLDFTKKGLQEIAEKKEAVKQLETKQEDAGKAKE